AEMPNSMSTYIENNWHWVALGLLIFIIIIVRFRLLGIPLERDEGEYAYMGQLMLKGHAPYSMAYNMKYPGTAMMYALLMSVFGQTATGVHLGLLVTNVGSLVLIYLIGSTMMSRVAGLVAAICFGMLSLGYHVLGFALHATHFVSLFALLGAWMMLKAIRSEKSSLYFWSGGLLSLSFLMKQPGIVFPVFGVIYVLLHHFYFTKEAHIDRFKFLAWMTLGLIAPVVLILLWIFICVSFDQFWFWTYTYLKEYGTSVKWSTGKGYLIDTFGLITSGTALIWISAGLGLIFCIFKSDLPKEFKIFLWLFFGFSALTVVPGFYFRAHYFITVLPSIALLCGSMVYMLSTQSYFSKKMGSYAGIILLSLGVMSAINSDNKYLFKTSPDMISREKYGMNPFVESEEIGRYIKRNSTKDDKIVVFGSEPQITFYADRISATGHIYTYGLMEAHALSGKMQDEMIQEIEAGKPKYFVYVSVSTSWTRQEYSLNKIFDWSNEYLSKYYTKVGVVDLISKTQTVYKWDNEALGYTCQSPYFIYIFRRL
ncbi:MAG: glycosyltransferase family 39 protein, partial [Saprospiraceae bacterium]